VLLTGLDIEKKAEVYLDMVFQNLGGREQFDSVDVQLLRTDKENPATNEEAFATLRVTVTTRDPKRVGRLFAAKLVELGLATIPGNAGRGGGFDGSPAMIHWPALIDSHRVTELVHLGDVATEVLPTQRLGLEEKHYQRLPVKSATAPGGPTVRIPFGRIYGARSGDKGGAANCGVWARSDAAWAFLDRYLTVEEFKRLCPDMARYEIDRYEMPNLRALNFYIRGVLGAGAASNSRIDRQAKSLGEYLRAKMIDAPKVLADKVGLKV
jgi:hypothetical protein